ncbi:G1/S-specific cyclin pas1 [Wickerhamomyces ciferrii]|uniref:G1/S-specific cyclin pas1 n=1 Tax=Wickerhamomyces ciferrii (strain ATCC 14091 / BCRC 22168 / CBS 111 / JCM 3599 / NBRC 0793 / NRRL Y-1031 F-60-10) TaxID=1206466 RepID=K0KFW9_WICCF|nr:G1/S-specific cyclin pas1 [Wickerhamomyces ciferrii]CCH44055.1 G1/S-specific cyclin pas1 [Wickerhamomyces ciferrii]
MAHHLTPEDGLKSSNTHQSIIQDQIHQIITPPPSVKQSTISSINSNNCDRSTKAEIANKFVSEASVFILSLWKNPNVSNVDSLFNNNLINQRDYERFTREVMKRSRCSLAALQISMYYLFKLQTKIKNRFISNNKSLFCPKKTFLICLILSFKFNYDSNYTFKSWSKVSGLSIKDLKNLEFEILKELDYNLNCFGDCFTKWESLLSQALAKIEKIIAQKSLIESSSIALSKKRNFNEHEQFGNYKKVRV